jgi:hypothetical protein
MGAKPLDMSVSSKGVLMVRFPHELKLFSSRLALHAVAWLQLTLFSETKSTKLTKKDFMGFAFSADGEFCAFWESDNASSATGERLYHSWDVWKTSTSFQKLGNTINHRRQVGFPNASNDFAKTK